MQYQDYYKILGINKDASKEEIQRAYRKLARKYHPDINKDKSAEETFKQINEAYEVLKDPEKKKRYDTLGEHWQQEGGFQPPPNWEERYRSGPRSQNFSRSFHFSNADNFEGASDFSDFFNSLFGDAYQSGGQDARQYAHFDAPGRSHEAEITVSLADVYHGAVRTISMQSYESDGRGQVRPVNKTLQVKIPKGVTNGSVIRLAGQGEKGAGRGEAGDLLLRITIAPDPRFHVAGHNLHTAVPISPWEAVLGAKIPLQTVEGNVTLTVPKHSQNGRKLRLRGKGIPKRGGGAGDIIVELTVSLPESISTEEEQLFKDLARKSRFNPRLHQQQRAKRHEKT